MTIFGAPLSDVFFIASKLFWALFSPSGFLSGLIGVGFLLSLFKSMRRVGLRVLQVAAFGLILPSIMPIGDVLLHQLEYRFKPFSVCSDETQNSFAGIIVIGGSIGNVTHKGEQFVHLTESSDRIHLAAAIGRRFSDLPIIVSAGQIYSENGKRPEAELIADFLVELGIPRERIVLDKQARSTLENALNASRLSKVSSKTSDRPWILVTSAFHMPRAYATFSESGLQIVAAPTDWRMDEKREFLSFSLTENLARLDLATKEYIGLAAYWLSGRISDIFPKDNRQCG